MVSAPPKRAEPLLILIILYYAWTYQNLPGEFYQLCGFWNKFPRPLLSRVVFADSSPSRRGHALRQRVVIYKLQSQSVIYITCLVGRLCACVCEREKKGNENDILFKRILVYYIWYRHLSNHLPTQNVTPARSCISSVYINIHLWLNDERLFDVHLTIYTEPFTRRNHERVSACHIMICHNIITVHCVTILWYTITIITPPSEMLYFSVKILYFVSINLFRYTRYLRIVVYRGHSIQSWN